MAEPQRHWLELEQSRQGQIQYQSFSLLAIFFGICLGEYIYNDRIGTTNTNDLMVLGCCKTPCMTKAWLSL